MVRHVAVVAVEAVGTWLSSSGWCLQPLDLACGVCIAGAGYAILHRGGASSSYQGSQSAESEPRRGVCELWLLFWLYGRVPEPANLVFVNGSAESVGFKRPFRGDSDSPSRGRGRGGAGRGRGASRGRGRGGGDRGRGGSSRGRGRGGSGSRGGPSKRARL